VPTAFDLRRALRRLKPDKHIRLIRRSDSDLAFASNEEAIGAPLLLDTCVYLHVLRGNTPVAVDMLLRTRALYHSAVAVAELTFRLGAKIPANKHERMARQQLEAVIGDIPAHRLVCPTAAIWCEAGIVAGIRARAGGISTDQRGVNDALIFLQAHSIGALVLTANVADFDILQQVAPAGRVVFYRDSSTRE
jgi:predicted nucleic acid-binding protein